jgi:hypothetical protein
MAARVDEQLLALSRAVERAEAQVDWLLEERVALGVRRVSWPGRNPVLQ